MTKGTQARPSAPAGRLAALLALVLAEHRQSGDRLAAEVHLSRSGMHRTFLRNFGESPAGFRRRLLLEQAAWTLVQTQTSVTDLAFDCGFASLEAFTRAFRWAYGVSPSFYRRQAHDLAHPHSHDLPARSGLHFRPHGVCHTAQEDRMDIFEHLLAFDHRFVQQALKLARSLPESALDQPLGQAQPLSFEAPDRTLRQLLDKCIFTKEVWLAAVRGDVSLPPEDRDRTLTGLEARLEGAYPAFLALALEVQHQGRWREQFRDALCEPAEQFPYGGMLAHVLSLDAHRRHVLSAWFGLLGVRLQADPMHFAADVPLAL
jgi:AraC family transcriptional regulator